MAVALSESWLKVLGEEFDKPYMQSLKSFLQEEKRRGSTIYPKGSDIFNALNHTSFETVKVIILGQDPYHGAGQAHGLSFSVQKGIAIPPSLKNMYKELVDEYPGFRIPVHGNLTAWADQGVLLLNATLTVRANEAGSHQNKGWETFTDTLIRKLSDQRKGLVFLLWGRFAQQKEQLIDKQKHHVLKAAHPSPFSAFNGFFGCGHFLKANEYLIAQGISPINWEIADS